MPDCNTADRGRSQNTTAPDRDNARTGTGGPYGPCPSSGIAKGAGRTRPRVQHCCCTTFIGTVSGAAPVPRLPSISNRCRAHLLRHHRRCTPPALAPTGTPGSTTTTLLAPAVDKPPAHRTSLWTAPAGSVPCPPLPGRCLRPDALRLPTAREINRSTTDQTQNRRLAVTWQRILTVAHRSRWRTWNKPPTSMRERPLPVVPLPFVDEAFGSWLGRLALRYRMGVDELADQAGVSLDLGPACSRWLAAPPPVGPSLRRLSALCRLPSEVLQRMGAGEDATARFLFCEKCFFLNPEDVTAPYWKASWLRSQSTHCAQHEVRYDHLLSSTLSCERNLGSVQRYISKRKRLRARRLFELSETQRILRRGWRWLRLFEQQTGFDKWSFAGLTSVQSCPRRRAGGACDERTTDAVGNSCSPLMLPG